MLTIFFKKVNPATKGYRKTPARPEMKPEILLVVSLVDLLFLITSCRPA